MVEREKLSKPRSLDHFRQSSLYYLPVFNAIIYVSQHGIQGGLLEGYILVLAVISVWAITINALFLHRRYKVSIQ